MNSLQDIDERASKSKKLNFDDEMLLATSKASIELKNKTIKIKATRAFLIE